MAQKRILQISNGYLLELDQLARLLYALKAADDKHPPGMRDLEHDTGLPYRQVRNRVAIGRALGIFRSNKLALTPAGALIAACDPFLDAAGTLEYLHYSAAGNPRNLIWFAVFNRLLPDAPLSNQAAWNDRLCAALKAEYTGESLQRHVAKELNFIIDAYTNKNFKRLGLMQQSASGDFYQQQYVNLNLPVAAAILYDYAAQRDSNLLQVRDLMESCGAPGRLFHLDEPTLRLTVERLHERGWVYYESTHNLNQVRLKNAYTALSFLTAYYENRAPAEEKERLQSFVNKYT